MREREKNVLMYQERCCVRMIIVALQDEIDRLYALYNTVTDRFLGVNLGKYKAVGMVMDYKKCNFSDALERVDNPQPFSDIARHIEN